MRLCVASRANRLPVDEAFAKDGPRWVLRRCTPTRSTPTRRWLGACSPSSSRSGPGFRSSRWPHTARITTSTASASIWPPGCRASPGRPRRPSSRRAGCRGWRRTCRWPCRFSWREGGPALGYPFDWSVYEWLPGTNASPEVGTGNGTSAYSDAATGASHDTATGARRDNATGARHDTATGASRDTAAGARHDTTTGDRHDTAIGGLDLDRAAVDLAAFIRALQRVDTTGAHPRRRGARGSPLVENDDGVRKAIHELGDRIDGAAAMEAWEESLDATPYQGPGVWLHGDLLPGNLLVVDGRLSAVIDFGALNVGDPAADLIPAWNVFTGRSRQRFREATGADDAQWLRGRGWALTQAVIALPYYWDTNPGMVRQAMRAVIEVTGTPAR